MKMVYINSNSKTDFRLRRSALFMPASNDRALTKAQTLDCDCLIFDLEDAVTDEMRPLAHKNLKELVRGQDFGKREKIIRVSSLDDNGFNEDLEAALSCGPDAILLPKVNNANEINQVVSHIGSKVQIWAMIETPIALMNLSEICNANAQLTCLVVGPNDLAKETGTKMDRALMHPWLMQVICASRAYDLSVLDGVYNNFKDLDGFTAECKMGADMGFDGKTLIHPSQIEGANSAFGFIQEELEKAQKIIDAFANPENDGKGAIQIEGEMVERLHLDLAVKLIACHKNEG